MSDSERIRVGLFDSGVGGLSVYRLFAENLPGVDLVYFGDRLNAPYGDRPESEVRKLSLEIGRWLGDKDIDHLVVACNTISALDLDWELPEDVRVHNIINSGVLLAARSVDEGKVGLLATRNTVASGAWPRKAEERDLGLEFVSVPCQDLVYLIENGRLEGPEVEKVVRDAVEPMVMEGVEAVILGCTHFPLAAGAIREVLDGLEARAVGLIDPAEALLQSVAVELPEEYGSAGEGGERKIHFSGEDEIGWLREAIPELEGSDIITGCTLIEAEKLEARESTDVNRES